MKIRIVDTTLRDGEQRAGTALGEKDKLKIARLLDSLEIFQIEAGIPAMGGEEKRSICRMRELGLKSRISTWNRIHTGDIRHSADCRPDIVHLSAPVSDIQIRRKLDKDRNWVLQNVKRTVCYAKERGFEVTLGLEDASRADFRFLIQVIATAFLEGVDRIRYADTVGILYRKRLYEEIKGIRDKLAVQVEMHAHNDLGMAVANSIAAVKAGAEFIDCTIGGIGERAGNCNFLQFLEAARGCLGVFHGTDMEAFRETQNEILAIMAPAR